MDLSGNKKIQINPEKNRRIWHGRLVVKFRPLLLRPFVSSSIAFAVLCVPATMRPLQKYIKYKKEKDLLSYASSWETLLKFYVMYVICVMKIQEVFEFLTRITTFKLSKTLNFGLWDRHGAVSIIPPPKSSWLVVKKCRCFEVIHEKEEVWDYVF